MIDAAYSTDYINSHRYDAFENLTRIVMTISGYVGSSVPRQRHWHRFEVVS